MPQSVIAAELAELRTAITRHRDESAIASDGLPAGFKSREHLYMRFHELLSLRAI